MTMYQKASTYVAEGNSVVYTREMSDKVIWPPRLSLPLSEDERQKIIDLKATLQHQRRTLKDFVMDAIWEKWKQEQGKAQGPRK